MTTEELKVVISAEVSKLKEGVKTAKKEISSFSSQVEKAKGDVDNNFKKLGAGISSSMKKAGVGIAAGGAALTAFGLKTASAADTIDKMSQRLGLSREAYQQWDYILSQSGVDINSFQTGMKSLLKNMDGAKDGAKASTEMFDKLGVSVVNNDGVLRSQEEVLKDVVNAFQGMENGAEKSRLAQEIFGKQGQEILPLLNAESGSMEELMTKCNELGLVMSDETITAGVNLTDTMDDAKRAFGAVGTEVGTVVMPIIQSILEYVINKMPEVKETISGAINGISTALKFCKEHKALLITIGTAIGVIVAAIGAYNVVAAVKAAMAAAEVTTVWGLVSAYAAQAAAMMVALAPYILIAAAIAAVIAAIVLCIKHWDTIKEKVTTVVSIIKEKVVTAFTAVKTTITNVLEGAKNKVTSIFTNIKTTISNTINGAKDIVKGAIEKIKGFFSFSWSLPKLKMPHVKIDGSFSLVPPSVPKFSIDWYAKGGVFDTPTLFNYGNALGGLGEAGAEAVVPLENNTQWLNKIADMLVEKMGGNTPIVMQVDGKTFAEVSVSSINNLTRQRGSLPLNLI